MSLAPATKGSELVERINALAGKPSSPFVVTKLKADAKALIQSDAHTAYSILGMLACLERNEPECRANHDKALRLGRDSWTLGAYGMSMKKLHQWSDATTYLEQAYDLSKGDLVIIDDLIDCNMKHGHMSEAGRWLAEWNKVSPDRDSAFQLGYADMLREMDEHDVSEEQIIEYFTIAWELAASNGYDSAQQLFRHLGGDTEMSFVIYINGTIDGVVDLNIRLAEALVDKDLVPGVTSVLTIDFESQEAYKVAL